MIGTWIENTAVGVRSLLVVLAIVPVARAGELGFPSVAFGNSYQTIISDDTLQKSPVWKDNDENPPVSARQAMAAAEAVVARLIAPSNEWRRQLDGITLTQKGNRWFWRAQFVWFPKDGGLGGLPPYMDVIVLMDGKAIEPSIIERKVDKRSDD